MQELFTNGLTCMRISLSGDIEKFKERSMCNFEYLLATLHATNYDALMVKFELVTRHIIDIDLHLVHRCLLFADAVLKKDPLQLAIELIGRLRPIKGQRAAG